jgi:hypothetical protein
MLLMGGMDYFNNKSRWGTVSLYGITLKAGVNFEFKGEAKIKGKNQDLVNDYFPQNQWIIAEENKENGMPQSLYALGRQGIYNVSLKYEEKEKKIKGLAITWADEGFNKNLDKDMDSVHSFIKVV